jgi:hypothetical protein
MRKNEKTSPAGKLSPDEVRTEVESLYDEMERRYGRRFTEFLLGRREEAET